MTLLEKKIYLYPAMLALASWILVNLTDLDELSRGLTPTHGPDYFSKAYTKWEMGDTGKLKSKLSADKLTHYSDDGKTHLDQPRIFFHNEKTPPWVIDSETGVLSADGKDLLLNGKVTIERAGGQGVKPLKILTSDLKVKPATSYAETDKRAELLSLPNKTTGTGMKLVFIQPIHVELLANVKGKYEKK